MVSVFYATLWFSFLFSELWERNFRNAIYVDQHACCYTMHHCYQSIVSWGMSSLVEADRARRLQNFIAAKYTFIISGVWMYSGQLVCLNTSLVNLVGNCFMLPESSDLLTSFSWEFAAESLPPYIMCVCVCVLLASFSRRTTGKSKETYAFSLLVVWTWCFIFYV